MCINNTVLSILLKLIIGFEKIACVRYAVTMLFYKLSNITVTTGC